MGPVSGRMAGRVHPVSGCVVGWVHRVSGRVGGSANFFAPFTYVLMNRWVEEADPTPTSVTQRPLSNSSFMAPPPGANFFAEPLGIALNLVPVPVPVPVPGFIRRDRDIRPGPFTHQRIFTRFPLNCRVRARERVRVRSESRCAKGGFRRPACYPPPHGLDRLAHAGSRTGPLRSHCRTSRGSLDCRAADRPLSRHRHRNSRRFVPASGSRDLALEAGGRRRAG